MRILGVRLNFVLFLIKILFLSSVDIKRGTRRYHSRRTSQELWNLPCLFFAAFVQCSRRSNDFFSFSPSALENRGLRGGKWRYKSDFGFHWRTERKGYMYGRLHIQGLPCQCSEYNIIDLPYIGNDWFFSRDPYIPSTLISTCEVIKTFFNMPFAIATFLCEKEVFSCGCW